MADLDSDSGMNFTLIYTKIKHKSVETMGMSSNASCDHTISIFQNFTYFNWDVKWNVMLMVLYIGVGKTRA